MFKRPTTFRAIKFLFLVFFLIGSVISLLACKSKDELYRDGIKTIEQKNYRGAVVYLKKALEKDPNYFEARFQLAKAYANLGNFESAEKDLQKVVRQSPSFRDAHIELARVYVYQNKPDEALREIQSFIGDESIDAVALEVAGLAYAEKGEYATAEKLYKRAISADNGGKTTAEMSLIRLYMAAGRTADAKAYIQEVLKKNSSDARALHALAEIQISENMSDEALKSYDLILRDYPEDGIALFKKGMLLIYKGKLDQALSIADNLLEQHPKRSEGYRLKGSVLFHKRNFDEAIAALQKSVSMQPNSGAFYLLGLSYFYKNELEQALSQFNKSLDLYPAFAQARVMKSMVLLKQGRVDDAMSEAEKTLKTDDKNVLAHNILGSAYLAKGMTEEGMKEYDEALKIDPKLSNVHLMKGVYNLGKGKQKEAESEMRAAIEIAPDILNSRLILASQYARNQEYNKALAVVKEGIRGQKTDAVYYTVMAEILLRQNKMDDAVKALIKAKETNPAYLAPYFKLATVYLLKKDANRAIQELSSVVSRSPQNVKALLELAAIYEAKNNDGEALRYLNQAKGTQKPEGYIAMSHYYVRKKQPDVAVRILSEAIAKNPANTSLLEQKGKIQFSQKKYADALKTFEELEKKNAKVALPYIVNMYIAMKKPEEALSRVQSALQKDPQNFRLMAELSKVYMIMGKQQEAIENASRMIERRPDMPAGYVTLALIYQNQQEINSAIEVLKKAARLNDLSIDMMLGGLYERKRDFKNALAIYKGAEKRNPRYAAAIYQQGVVYHAMGNVREASMQYARALKVSGNFLPALNNLAYIYAQESRDLDKAMQYAARAYVLAPNDGNVLDTFGFVLLKNKKNKDALQVLKKASDSMPDNPTILYHLALAYKENADEAQAMSSLQKAIQIGNFPDEKNARILLEKLQKG